MTVVAHNVRSNATKNVLTADLANACFAIQLDGMWMARNLVNAGQHAATN